MEVIIVYMFEMLRVWLYVLSWLETPFSCCTFKKAPLLQL